MRPDDVVVDKEVGHGALGFGTILAAPGLLVRREAVVPFFVWLMATQTKMVRSNSATVIKLFSLFIASFTLLIEVLA